MTGADGNDEPTAAWPVGLDGVTETVVATLGPNELWNLAALGVEAGENGCGTARTWGRTRTWRNFCERGEGVIQFVTDPRTFVDAALTIREESEPVVASADAWVRVAVERLDAGESGGTQWVDWRLRPVESVVRTEKVRTIDRGFAAVIEATVAASRLDVATYDTERLVERLNYFASVVETAGSERDRVAFEAIDEAVGWRDRE